MTYNAALTERVRNILINIPSVKEKRMFRGITFMVNGKMCLSVGDDELMVRIDPKIHNELVKIKGVRSMIMKGKEYKGYVFIHESIIRSDEELITWINRAIIYNRIITNKTG